ncbi:hypothetical protein H8959_007315 [Pygathrix nigripes]
MRTTCSPAVSRHAADLLIAEEAKMRLFPENTDTGSTLALDASGSLIEGTHRRREALSGQEQSFTQQIKQELLDGFHFSIFFKEGQGPPATNHGQCWSGYENEICRMPTFQTGRGEKLLVSLVPVFLTKPISSYATCLGPSWDFITVPHFLELLVRSTTTSILFTWPPENTSVCCQTLQRSYFWIKLAFRTLTWPGLGLEDHQEIVLGQLVLLEPKEAKPEDPAPPPGQHALTMLVLEPAPPLLVDLRPALEPESRAALDAPGYLYSAPAPAPGEGPLPGTVLEPQLLAEQLTLMDAELLKKVELYECMGSIWGQRHQKGSEHVAPTVCATIAHFNRLINCVTTSCLGNHSMRAQDRARVVEHWIKVARVSPCALNDSERFLETRDIGGRDGLLGVVIKLPWTPGQGFPTQD